MEKCEERRQALHSFQCQPDHPGNEIGELEAGFPFPEIIRCQHHTGLDGNLAQPGDEKLPSNDKSGDPDRAESSCREKYESGADEDLVRERVEQFSKWSDEIELSSQIAV